MPSRAALLSAAALLFASLAGAAANPPRIGLVLGGGGARGAAHIGVLEVLERLRVPVHCVAGTSMGAIVAGAFTSGVSPERMRAEMAIADWADIFDDSPNYTELELRHKRLAQRFLPGSELGLADGGVRAPPGVVAGQKVKQFFNRLVRADLGDPDIAHTALPLAIVATDIGTGERVIFRAGSLTRAMRASMSVPGLMAPAEVDGRKLVDGGLVDNLPVKEVRELCRPDVVIAVNVGTPLLAPREVGSLLTVTAQMVAILTEQNVTRSLAELTPQDIYIRPALDGIGPGDFDRHAEAAERGRAAAEALAGRLASLALPPSAYTAWQQGLQRATPQPPRVDAVEVAGLVRVNPEAVARHLSQRTGEPLDAERLQRELLRVYGDGHYENVDYELVNLGGRRLLRVLPVEKRWGPDYLRFALALASTLGQGSTYSLRAAWQKTWLNAWGAELLLQGELGRSSGAAAEWLQPLGAAQRWFADASVAYRRERQDLFLGESRVAQYLVERSTAEAALGLNLGRLGALRIGRRELLLRPGLETGLPLLPTTSLHRSGWLATLELDQLDRVWFPTRGWALRASWFDTGNGSADRPGYSKSSAELRLAWPVADTVFGARVASTVSPRGTLPPFDAASLGGFLNLSGYSSGQLLADSVHYAHLRTERIVGKLPLGLRGDLRLGAAIEVGRLGQPLVPSRLTGGWIDSATLYLGGQTPLGPVYLGAGYSSRGGANAYLFIGAP